MKSDIAVLYDTKEFQIFKLAGADMFMVQKNDAREKLLEMAGKYKLIIITETLAKLLEDDLKAFEGKLEPTILFLPSPKGEGGFALKNLTKKARTSLGLEI